MFGFDYYDAITLLSDIKKNDPDGNIDVALLQAAVNTESEIRNTATLERKGVFYRHPDHIRFIIEMENAGYVIFLYHGKNSYHGPAVVIKGLNEASGSTSLKCQSDNFGFDYVWYPSTTDRFLENAYEK